MSSLDYKLLHRQFKYLLKRIKEEERIVIYRHSSPDYDALGTQMGLYTWIKDNFPSKEVHYVGDYDKGLMEELYPAPEEVDDSFFEKDHLAITVDVANRPRIGLSRIDKAKEVIKIDHHPLPVNEEERFGDYVIVYPDRPAASEIIALFTLVYKNKYKLSKEAAAYLYSGIVGDTGRFLYNDTDRTTLSISASLLDTGFDKQEIYRMMYEKDLRDMQIFKCCMDKFKITEKGTGYYILDKEDLERFDMTTNEGNKNLNYFRDLKNVRLVASITYIKDREKDNGKYRVSLRASKLIISSVANKFGGGGHDYAAGCTISSLDELQGLLDACDSIGEEN